MKGRAEAAKQQSPAIITFGGPIIIWSLTFAHTKGILTRIAMANNEIFYKLFGHKNISGGTSRIGKEVRLTGNAPPENDSLIQL